MAYPSDSDFQLYDGSLITSTQFDYNFQRIPTFWSSGTYDINVDSITANTYNNLPTNSFTATAGETITAGDVVRWSGGQIFRATNASSAGVTSLAGIASTTTVTGQTVTVVRDYYNSLSGLTAGTTYYVGVDGAVVTTEPAAYPVEIGFASSTTQLNIRFKEDTTPTGTIIAYTTGIQPNGTLRADGSNISRTTYARLFDVIGTTYGIGDGSTTFGLPDYDGEFLRGLDSSRSIGDTQADATAVNGLSTGSAGSHNHLMFDTIDVGAADFVKPTPTTNVAWSVFRGGGNDYAYQMSQSTSPSVEPTIGFTNTVAAHTHTLSGDTETRPSNISVLYAIKL
jgi:microcystin-dependent protein